MNVDKKVEQAFAVLSERTCDKCIHKYSCSISNNEINTCEYWSDKIFSQYRELFEKKIKNTLYNNHLGVFTKNTAIDIKKDIDNILDNIKNISYDFKYDNEMIESDECVNYIIKMKDNPFSDMIQIDISIRK